MTRAGGCSASVSSLVTTHTNGSSITAEVAIHDVLRFDD